MADEDREPVEPERDVAPPDDLDDREGRDGDAVAAASDRTDDKGETAPVADVADDEAAPAAERSPSEDEDADDAEQDADAEAPEAAASGHRRRVRRLWPLLFVIGGLVVGVAIGRLRRPAPPRQGRAARPAAASTARVAPRRPSLPQEFAGLSYEALLRSGDENLRAGEAESAVRFYRAAVVRAEGDITRTTLARYRCSRALAEAGSPDRALEILRSLRILSRPGDGLWRACTTAALHLLAREGRWPAFLRELYLLRANSDRYPDRLALRRAYTYRRAMALAQIALRASGEAPRRGILLDRLGREGLHWPELGPQDVPARAAALGDGTLVCRTGKNGLRLTAAAAPLRAVLRTLREVGGIEAVLSDAPPTPVTAQLLDVPAEEALEILLGTAGYRLQRRGDALHAVPATRRDARRSVAGAEAALKRFLLLGASAEHVPETYYALAALYSVEGNAALALDQLAVLRKEFPRSKWVVPARYLAGITRAARKEWALAERHLLVVLDAAPRSALALQARLRAAECQEALEKYKPALAHFQRLLKEARDDALVERLLYHIAFCMERLDYPAAEVEARYGELRLRFPNGRFASLADYRLARLALEGGDYALAARRCRRYLETWSIRGPHGPQVCGDLLQAWIALGDPVRAVALGETLRAALAGATAPSLSAEQAEAWRRTYRRRLPDLLVAAEAAGLHELSLAYLDELLAAAATPSEARRLRLRRADVLIEMGRWDEAEALLDRIEAASPGAQTRRAAALVRARLLLHNRRETAALNLWHDVAQKADHPDLRAKALQALGRYYEDRGDFVAAARVYEGQCPAGGAAGDLAPEGSE